MGHENERDGTMRAYDWGFEDGVGRYANNPEAFEPALSPYERDEYRRGYEDGIRVNIS